MSEEYEYHPAANLFPLMEGEEFEALKADIEANGLQEPITLYDGKILDGRNRYRACKALGLSIDTKCERISRLDLGCTPRAYVLSLNLHRRHLTPEQKREVVAKLLKANPNQSDRAVGKKAGVDHKTVKSVRTAGEARGEIPHVETRADSKGRKQPAKKKATPASTTQKADGPSAPIIKDKHHSEITRELMEKAKDCINKMPAGEMLDTQTGEMIVDDRHQEIYLIKLLDYIAKKLPRLSRLTCTRALQYLEATGTNLPKEEALELAAKMDESRQRILDRANYDEGQE